MFRALNLALAFAVAAVLALPAHADVIAGSQSLGLATANPQNIGNTVINMPAAPGLTGSYGKQDFNTNQAATPGTVFVNPPAADTCAKPGDGFSVGLSEVQIAASKGGGESAKCDMRSDTINLKVTGAPMEVIKARHCMDAQMEEAYARAGMACVDARPVKKAEAQPAVVVQAPTDRFIAMSGRSWPSK